MAPGDRHELRVRHVRATEHQRLREIRLAALATDPDAFGSTHAEEVAEPADWWTRWAAESEDGTEQRTFVADDGNRWLALALCRVDDAQPRSAAVFAMWVTPDARGQRIARRLCEAAGTWAADHGCDELTLSVVPENDPARRAYEAAGFSVSGTTSWERNGEHLEMLVMTRPL